MMALAAIVLVLAAVVLSRVKKDAVGRIASLTLCAAAIVLLGLYLVRSISGDRGSAGRALAFDESAAFVLGREVARSIPAPAKILVAQPAPIHDGMRAEADRRIAALRAGLGAQGYTIEQAHPPVPDEEALADEDVVINLMRLDAARLREYLRTQPDAAAIVSFAGLPLLNGGRLPPLFVLGAAEGSELAAAIRRGAVHAAVVTLPTVDPKATPRRGMSPEAIFALRYRLITGNE